MTTASPARGPAAGWGPARRLLSVCPSKDTSPDFGPVFARAFTAAADGAPAGTMEGAALATRFDRSFYVFSVETTPSADAVIVAEFNAAPNKSRFNFFYRNCSDQAKGIFDLILPHATGDRTSGITMQTPKRLPRGWCAAPWRIQSCRFECAGVRRFRERSAGDSASTPRSSMSSPSEKFPTANRDNSPHRRREDSHQPARWALYWVVAVIALTNEGRRNASITKRPNAEAWHRLGPGPSENVRRKRMARRSLFGVLVAALIAVMMPAPAGALTYDKLTYMTFSGPVQIPGVTLGAGTYRFRLANPDTSRNVLQVLSNDGATVFAMFNTIPDHRAALTDEAAVTFRETPVGVPPAIRSLFYGGEYRGYEFVYPKGGPVMIADVPPQPEITFTPSPAAEAVAEAIVEPVAEAVAEPAPVAEAAVEPLPQAEPVELPRTASPLPLAAAGGLTSLLLALGLGLLRRRVI